MDEQEVENGNTESANASAQRWTQEFASARKPLEQWHMSAEIIDKEFRNEAETNTGETRLGVFTSSVQTMQAMLYGQTPRVDVGRRFADAKDDDARMGGEMVERLLNTDIISETDNYTAALRYCMSDRLLAGFANARVRYVRETEPVAAIPSILGPDGRELAPEVPAQERVVHEDVETDWVHWKDQLWSPAKVFHEVTWWAFKAQMTRAALVKRFGDKIGNQVPLNSAKSEQTQGEDPHSRADVWEIWDKGKRKVFWFVEGYPAVLDVKDDPLGLPGFWPFPEPLIANVTTSKYVPRPDYALHQDLYKGINKLMTRIDELEDAIRVSGVYDDSADGVQRLMTEGGRNTLIPVKGWAKFAEKGGLKGQIDWFPLEQIVAALAVLHERLTVKMDLLYQMTGWSDILRGEATQAGATATEQRVKAQAGSVRIRRFQDEFARFASDLQTLKAQIISKHFSPETIVQRSNALKAFDDHAAVQRAVDLIKSDLLMYKIEVKPESVNLTDFAAVKQERTEVITTIATYFQAAAPLAQGMPEATPYLLEILQWLVAGLRGSSQIEGVLDKAVTAAQQAQQQRAANPQPPPPDQKLLAIQAKAQADMVKGKQDLENDIVRSNLKVQESAQIEENQRISNVKEAAQRQLVTNALKPPAPPPGARKPGGAL